jgi:TetR/AcrR family transcriptional regulator, cholesterol catabolism regulator
VTTHETKPAPVETPHVPRKRIRERQKQQRFARIKLAARQLFLKNGYDRTTLRVIGRRAKVGAGTILRYVEDKRELLFLLFDEDHKAVTESAYAELSEDKEFLDQSIDGFRSYYRYFAANPEYARTVLREATFFDPLLAEVSPANDAGWRSINRIKRTVEIARRRGEIIIAESDDTLARLIFEIYQIECRRWLATAEPDVESGLKALRRALAILTRGLASRS